MDKEAYTKFFTDVNKAMAVRTKEKVTLAMVLKRNNVELDLPVDVGSDLIIEFSEMSPK
jgi:hypothetical protein